MTARLENYQNEMEKMAMKKSSPSDSLEDEDESIKSESFDEKDSFMNYKEDYDSSGIFFKILISFRP